MNRRIRARHQFGDGAVDPLLLGNPGEPVEDRIRDGDGEMTGRFSPNFDGRVGEPLCDRLSDLVRDFLGWWARVDDLKSHVEWFRSGLITGSVGIDFLTPGIDSTRHVEDSCEAEGNELLGGLLGAASVMAMQDELRIARQRFDSRCLFLVQ